MKLLQTKIVQDFTKAMWAVFDESGNILGVRFELLDFVRKKVRSPLFTPISINPATPNASYCPWE
eukprot:CAMPEP_0172566326 /NCGR_PEP_ID=MMETSP1067-20121228/111457_1 /TAXON_ID=265564 ORGANISM="Thalassiosira punctigera, Strain Tpunct2005C2" /NCGR_SAMPLE_ID=MMETSP1067 /ASSEMBLY_ACC=CAM_ASM_000444 /LENGTH=64 /DNA_ID=CAMNT_0013357409 /DNA_START=176 /DNA_END=370 /DNA_ORIENTATION=+